MEKTRKRKKVDNKKTLAFKKLKLLITIVNRNKAEYYLDLLQSQEINMQLVSLGKGTADSETLRYLGLAESEKVIIFSIIREDKIPSTLELLNQKFTTIKNGKIPLGNKRILRRNVGFSFFIVLLIRSLFLTLN